MGITASMPLLLCILNIRIYNKLFYFRQLLYPLNFNSATVAMGLGVVLAFLVKLPIFLGHMWLPKAHVEAPVVGSIILAAVLLKLGGVRPYSSSPYTLTLYHIKLHFISSVKGVRYYWAYLYQPIRYKSYYCLLFSRTHGSCYRGVVILKFYRPVRGHVPYNRPRGKIINYILRG